MKVLEPAFLTSRQIEAARQAITRRMKREGKIDVQNVLNAATPVYYYFDSRTETIQNVPQLAILPVMQYTLRF